MCRRYGCGTGVGGICVGGMDVVLVWVVYDRYICGWYMSRRHIGGNRCGRFMIGTYVGGIFVCGRNVGYVWVVYVSAAEMWVMYEWCMIGSYMCGICVGT